MFTGIVTEVGTVVANDAAERRPADFHHVPHQAGRAADRRLDRLQRHLHDGGGARRRGGQRDRVRGRCGAGDARRHHRLGMGHRPAHQPRTAAQARRRAVRPHGQRPRRRGRGDRRSATTSARRRGSGSRRRGACRGSSRRRARSASTARRSRSTRSRARASTACSSRTRSRPPTGTSGRWATRSTSRST